MYFAGLILLSTSLEKSRKQHASRRIIIRNSETRKDRTGNVRRLRMFTWLPSAMWARAAETLSSGHVNVGNKIGARGPSRNIELCTRHVCSTTRISTKSSVTRNIERHRRISRCFLPPETIIYFIVLLRLPTLRRIPKKNKNWLL